jgi:hypothetical protein
VDQANGKGDIEPLETGLWFQEWGKLVLRSRETDEELERVLRHAFHLVQLAPRPLRHVISCPLSEQQFEAVLEAQAWESATVALLGNYLGFVTSRHCGETVFTAEVSNPDDPARHRASDRSFARAVLGAWLSYLVMLGSESVPATHQDPHTRQSSPRQRPTRH